MPFGPYTDWEDCLAQNQDAGDPQAVCGAIKARLEKGEDVELTREQVRKLCPSCAEQMEKRGWTVLKVPTAMRRDEQWLSWLRESLRTDNEFTVAKLDESQNLVFGWASVAVKADGLILVDKQGDQIEPADLEKAAYDFVEHSRVANEMHRGGPVGVLVESLVVTPEKLEAMGLQRAGVAKAAPQAGLWVGFRVRPDVFAKVKAGKLRMFSIEGTAKKVAA